MVTMKGRLTAIFLAVLSLAGCASYQTDMNANVPNQNDVPLSTSMPPVPTANVQMD